MERKTTKKILAILMIITILITDFLVVASNLITYATKQFNKETNNPNVEFSAHFKDGDERVESIQKSIKDQELKLYAEINVKNEGYLKEDTVLEIENSNFDLKNEILPSNKYIKSIEGNKVILKQIDNGNAVEIELAIEAKTEDIIKTDYLSSASTVKFIGTYIYSEAENGEAVKAEKLVCVDFQPDIEVQAELNTEIITNKVLEVKGSNQRVIQLLVKSRLQENQYPVKQTKLNVNIPEIGDELPQISVLAIDELATNGLTEINNEDYQITENKVEITLKNEPNENGEIKWIKEAYDELIITFIYPKEVDLKDLELKTDSQILLYNLETEYTASHSATVEIENNSAIAGRTEINLTEENSYKGQLYANSVSEEDVNIEYETETKLIVTKEDIVEKITINEGQDVLATEREEKALNTRYICTALDLNEMLSVLGQDGNIEIKNGESITFINKDTEKNEYGQVVVNYDENSTSELIITTSNPVTSGVIKLHHQKEIIENNYTREELKQVKTLKAKGTIIGTKSINKEEQKIVENSTETSNSSIELKETISKAELLIDKTMLSTTEPNEVTVGVKLITDGVKYDLFKDPSIIIQMPSAVEKIELLEEPTKLYDDTNELQIKNAKYDSQNKTIILDIEGEQTKYPKTSVLMQLKLNVELSKFAISQSDKASMGYKNENASQYDSGTTEYGVVDKEIQISAPSQLIKQFNLSSNENTSLNETILHQIKAKDIKDNLEFEIGLINNKDTDINNVKILGKLPTTENIISGEEENTLKTTLKNIEAENATIYYTENVEATVDIEDDENGWTTDLSTLTNAKLYLIKLENLERGTSYNAKIIVQVLDATAEANLSYTQYQVIYDTATETNVEEYSRKIGIAPSLAASIKTSITAQVGQDEINNGDIVKEGEVIKYTVTLNNKGTQNLQNVELKLNVPEGSVYVRPIQGEYVLEDGTVIEDGYVYVPDAYYEEITDGEKLKELTEITIPELTRTEPYVIKYEVRINKGTVGTELTNKPTIVYDNVEVNGAELKNIVEEANVRATIKRTKDESNLSLPGSSNEYIVYVENISNSAINNLQMQIISDTFNVERIEDMNGVISNEGNVAISKIEANDMIYFTIYGHISETAKEIKTSVIVSDSEGNRCRSNSFEEVIPQIDATINLTSPQDGEEIKQDDLIQYNIVVKNTGNIESAVVINDIIPSYMTVQEIKVTQNNVTTTKQSINEVIINDVTEVATLKPGETVKLEILSKVKYISNIDNGITINNMATVEVSNAKDITSEIVSHILKANLEETKGNSISGLVWLDEEANMLPDVNLKLYDVSANNYVVDENENIVQTKTNSKGEYTFTEIKNGSYLIIIDGEYEPAVDSNAIPKVINVNGRETTVIAVEINDLKENLSNINIGLKEKTEELPTQNKKTISGNAWLDENMNGQKDSTEKNLPGIKVKIYNAITKNYLTEEVVTDEKGNYQFSNIENGSYILVFEYDTENYKPTTYMAEGVEDSKNSKVVYNNLNIDGKEQLVAVTDIINVENNVTNINIGLKEILTFDLELNKYINRMIVQTSKETKEYKYENSIFEKVEIHKNQIDGALVVLEYTIKIKNNGEISGYAKNIVDYLPNGITFSSELNKDWYLSENYLYTKSLENIELKPGEEKEIKLILTKTMTGDNVGLINNRAEIYQDYNKYGEVDIDSTPNNQVQEEDDFGSVDTIIQIATGGGTSYMILLIVNIILIGIAIRIMIKNGIIIITTKEERR